MRPVALILALLALACKQPSVDVPEPPDMSGVLQAFEAPSAPLSAATVDEIVAKQKAFFEQIESLGGLEPVLAALGAVDSGTETSASALQAGGDGAERLSSALQVGTVTVTGDGFLTVTRTCAGWLGATTPDPADGTITLTAVFDDEGFDRVVWGQATACRYLVDGHRLTLDGQVRVHTGTLLVDHDTGAQLTLGFDGRAQVDDRTFAAAFTFRVTLSSTRVEIALDVSAGSVIFFADDSARVYGFRAANGTWTCDFEEGSCSHDGDTLRLW